MESDDKDIEGHKIDDGDAKSSLCDPPNIVVQAMAATARCCAATRESTLTEGPFHKIFHTSVKH